MLRTRRGTAAVAEHEAEHHDREPSGDGAQHPKGTEGVSEHHAPRGKGQTIWPWTRQSAVTVKLIYAGLLVSLAAPPAAFIAALFAHLGRQTQPNSWLASHYTYQIRTFWIGLVAHLCAYALSLAGIGFLMFPLIAVWLVARAVNGIAAIAQRRPIDDPFAVVV